mmetsp:Transcript_11629/g.48914  ORF Transcript_11629/g.48914 Transcript_11629/m.48914 type:complete len:249 (+) Transcript_11629:254-1000(+)
MDHSEVEEQRVAGLQVHTRGLDGALGVAVAMGAWDELGGAVGAINIHQRHEDVDGVRRQIELRRALRARALSLHVEALGEERPAVGVKLLALRAWRGPQNAHVGHRGFATEQAPTEVHPRRVAVREGVLVGGELRDDQVVPPGGALLREGVLAGLSRRADLVRELGRLLDLRVGERPAHHAHAELAECGIICSTRGDLLGERSVVHLCSRCGCALRRALRLELLHERAQLRLAGGLVRGVVVAVLLIG